MTRQDAIKKGLKWYTPVTPCPKCGQTAPRRVDNGRCLECQIRARSGTPTIKFMADNPDKVISYGQALTLGLKVYRTGEPCKQGHRAYRYVSTRNCVECLKEARP